MKKMILIISIVLTGMSLFFYFGKSFGAAAGHGFKNHDNRGYTLSLGKKLYYAKIMGDNTMSCATCHVYSVGTYAYCGKKGGINDSLNNVREKIAIKNKIHHKNFTLRDITIRCFKYIGGKPLTDKEIHALDEYIRTLK